jgi:hypothetical protein
VGRWGAPDAPNIAAPSPTAERRVTLRSTRPTVADLDAGMPLAATVGIAIESVMVGELIRDGAARE